MNNNLFELGKAMARTMPVPKEKPECILANRGYGTCSSDLFSARRTSTT